MTKFTKDDPPIRWEFSGHAGPQTQFKQCRGCASPACLVWGRCAFPLSPDDGDHFTIQSPVGPQNITFSPGGKTVLTITHEGKLIPGDGLSDDEVTQGLFDAMAAIWPNIFIGWAEADGYVKSPR